MVKDKHKNRFNKTQVGKIYYNLYQAFNEGDISERLKKLYTLEVEKYIRNYRIANIIYEIKQTDCLKLIDVNRQETIAYNIEVQKSNSLTIELAKETEKLLNLEREIEETLSGIQQLKVKGLEKNKMNSLKNFINHYSTISSSQKVIIWAGVEIGGLNNKVSTTYYNFYTKPQELQLIALNKRKRYNKLLRKVQNIRATKIDEIEKYAGVFSNKPDISRFHKIKPDKGIYFTETEANKIFKKAFQTFKRNVSGKFRKIYILERKKYIQENKMTEILWNIKGRLDEASVELEKMVRGKQNEKEIKEILDNLDNNFDLIDIKAQMEKYSRYIKVLIDKYEEVQEIEFQNKFGEEETYSFQKKLLDIKSLIKKLEKIEVEKLKLERKIQEILSGIQQLEVKDLEKDKAAKLEEFIGKYNDWSFNQGVINRMKKFNSILYYQRDKVIKQYERAKSPEEQASAENRINQIGQFMDKANSIILLYKEKKGNCIQNVLDDSGQNFCRQISNGKGITTHKGGTQGGNGDSRGIKTFGEINGTAYVDWKVSDVRHSLKVWSEPQEKGEEKGEEKGKSSEPVRKRCPNIEI